VDKNHSFEKQPHEMQAYGIKIQYLAPIVCLVGRDIVTLAMGLTKKRCKR